MSDLTDTSNNRRQLRLAAGSLTSLSRDNRPHRFAANHALRLFQSHAIYSYIPKNACTTLRFSLAIANGCLSPQDDPHWVDQNNATFRAGLPDLILANYTFVVLRCPYRRLASAFLDKMTSDTPWRGRFESAADIQAGTLTYRQFVELMLRPGLRRSDHHWAPQIDFLVYRAYDDVFRLEDYDGMARTLEGRIGLKLYDTRDRIGHGLDRYRLIDGDFADMTADDIGTMRAEGGCPSVPSLYDAGVRQALEIGYAKDLNIYRRHFGGDACLYAPTSN